MIIKAKNLISTSGVELQNGGKDWSLRAEVLFTGKEKLHRAFLRWEIPNGVVPYADYWNISMAPTIPDGKTVDKEKVWLAVALIQAWLHIDKNPRTGMMMLNSIIRCRREPVSLIYYLIQPEAKQFKYMTVEIEFTGYIQRGARANIEVQAMGSLRTLATLPEGNIMDNFLESLDPAGPTQ